MESNDKKLEKNININNRYIDNNICINNISENITKKKTKQIIHNFEDYFIFWN